MKKKMKKMISKRKKNGKRNNTKKKIQMYKIDRYIHAINKKELDDKTKEIKRNEIIDGNVEYTKVLIKALKEALNENDLLRNYNCDLNEENSKMKQEITNKNEVILELADYYDYCQTNHFNKLK